MMIDMETVDQWILDINGRQQVREALAVSFSKHPDYKEVQAQASFPANAPESALLPVQCHCVCMKVRNWAGLQGLHEVNFV